jgi:hypothetical protein
MRENYTLCARSINRFDGAREGNFNANLDRMWAYTAPAHLRNGHGGRNGGVLKFIENSVGLRALGGGSRQ